VSHMVIFRTPEGKPGYQPADTVQDAIEVVERLRNDEGVENVRIFRLEELSFEYRPYYKVELATSGTPAAPEQPSGPTVFGSIDAGAPAEQLADESGDEPADDPTVDDMAPSAAAPIETSGNDVPPPPPAAPPWAAPPPPPPTFVAPTTAEQARSDQAQGIDDDDDEFTGAGGPRRGLFGR
jgi:hypothetical protein